MKKCIKQLNAADLDALIQLEKLCFAYHWSKEQFLMGLERGVFSIFGMKDDDKLIGYLALSFIADEMEVLNLAVHPEYRQKGIADAMFQKGLELCHEKSVKKSFLDVKISNTPAIRLYEKYGYVQVGVRKKYYPDTKEDALLYMLEFTQP